VILVWFCILGPTELREGKTSYALGAAKQRGLLALLLLYAGRPVRVDTLVEHLWPGGGADGRQKIIYSMVSRLRAVLGRSGVRHALIRVGSAYQLDVDPNSVDFHQFRALVERAREAMADDRPAAAVADLQRAVDLWRGEPVAELRGSAAEHLRRQLAESLLDARKLLADGRLRIGQHHIVLMDFESLIREHDLDESLARLWISALCAAGREDDARRYLAAFRKRFRRELQVDPRIDLEAIRTGQPRPGNGRPHQLPYSIPGFVGRADLLAELDRLAETGPGRPSVVVVTGMPGIGKTALAVHWSQRNLGLFSAGQLFLNCGGFGPGAPVDPKEALARFLHALGVPADRIPEDIDDRRHRFNDLLDGRRMLILLDDVADSDQARPLIPSAATCLTIITSRRRLSGLTVRDGVHSLIGYPLAEPEAGTLLAQIIGERRVAAEPAAVDQLAGLVGGLPLGLRIVGELVAERPRARLAELACELQEQVLWANTEDGGLIGPFGWSYRSLPADAAALFRRLALHPGSRISLDAAAALAGTDRKDTERALNLLARANLVEHDTVRQYRLHDLLRQYAEVRGEEEDTPSDIAGARLAISTWFLRSAANAAAILAPQLPPVPDLPAAPPYVMEFATEAAALAWCQSERENLAAAAKYAARHGMHRHAWQIPAAIHEILTRTGRYDDLIRLNEAGVESARLDAHSFGEVANLSNLGYAFHATHQYGRAITTLTAARARAAESGLIAAESACAHNVGVAFLSTGDTSRAIEIFQQVRAVSRRLANPFGESATLHRLGDAYRREKRPDLALAAYGEALEIRERIGFVRGQGQTHHQLSTFYLEAGELSLSAQHCTAALVIYDRIQEAAGRCDALITRADIERTAGSAAAVTHARTAVVACVELGDSYRRVHALVVLADALVWVNASHEAARTRAEAAGIAAELSGPDAIPLLERLFAASERASCQPCEQDTCRH
jgi:DNA-binding SARP family transcriptional activator/tetratricopeptide (TPR) repeat protein